MTEPNPTGGRHRLRDTDTEPQDEPMSPETAEATTWLGHDWPSDADNRRAELAGGE